MEKHHVIGGEGCSKRKKRDFGIAIVVMAVNGTVIEAALGRSPGRTAADLACNPTIVPLEEVMKDKLKINLREGGLNLTELAKAIDAKSLRSIREKLAGIIGDIFSYMKGIFQHIKIIF